MVAEAEAALGEDHLPVAGRGTFSIAWRMSSGARNWPFFTFTTRPVRAAADDQIGLARQERRDLQHVGDLGHARRPAQASWMSVRIGTPARVADPAKHAKPFVEAGAAEGARRGPVRLVVRRLEDVRDAGAAGDVAERERDPDRVRFALDDARARR